MLITHLDQIARIAAKKEAENETFKQFLTTGNVEEIDAMVKLLNEKIETDIDCTQCGNCCKTLMINVSEERANALANHLMTSRESFDEKYLEKGSNGTMLVNTIPCHFLQENKCTVYEHRFDGCREFPGLHLPRFTKRLFTVFMHYDRCPIVFNVVEELKYSLGFK